MVASSFVPFALPDIGEQEIAAVVTAMQTGWLTSGPKVKEFEEAFAQYLGEGVRAVSVNSATAGLHLALEAIGIGPGDEVLVPTWTFTATAEVVRYLGAEPILVDVVGDTLSIDLEAASKRITDRTRAVMPVHFAGLPLDDQELAAFSQRYGLAVVEDAAHGFPAMVNGAMVGAGSSAATVFSFYATKTMTTGEGGMVVTREPRIAERIKTMRLHGISRDVFDRYRSSTPAWSYEVIAPGYKYNLTDPAAAMGLVQLQRASAMRDRREAIANAYTQALSYTALELPLDVGKAARHSWHLYVVRVPDEVDRDNFINRLASRDVGTSVHFIPLHLHPYWRDRRQLRPEDFPVASREFQRVVSLPLYSSMTNEDVDHVIRAVMETVDETSI